MRYQLSLQGFSKLWLLTVVSFVAGLTGWKGWEDAHADLLPHGHDATIMNTEAIDTYVEAQMHDLHIPGLALGIVHDDKIVYLRGYGQADPSGRAVTPQTPFMLASVSKPLTALGIMQLVAAGKIDLDAPVQRYIPWFRVADETASRQITVRHLLLHTSGLSGRSDLAYAGSSEDAVDAIEQRVRALRSVELTHPAGTIYEYSNTGYQVLGLLIQQVTGEPYEAYVQAHVFSPLAMQHAFTAKQDAQQHGLATGYRYWFGQPLPYDTPFERGGLPSGFLMASAEDMAHFLIPHLNQGRFGATAIVSPKGMAELLNPVGKKTGGDESYAMDWGIVTVDGQPWLVKGGDLASFKTQLVLVPDGKWGVVTLINANNLIASQLGDLRIPFIPLGVTKLLLGRQPAVPAPSRLPLILLSVPAAILALQIIGLLRSLALVRRWRAQPTRRPYGIWGTMWQIGLPEFASLIVGLLALVGLPQGLQLPMSYLLYAMPDFGTMLVVIGIIGVGWSLVWLVLTQRVRHPR